MTECDAKFTLKNGCTLEAFMDLRLELMMTKLQSLDDRIMLRLDANDRAIIERTATLDKRLGAMNEFREALSDREAQYFTRKEHEAYQKLIEADIRVLRESRAELVGKASQTTVVIALIIALSGILISLAKFFMK